MLMVYNFKALVATNKCLSIVGINTLEYCVIPILCQVYELRVIFQTSLCLAINIFNLSINN